MSIRFFDIFSGIGGFRSGLEAVGGFECVGHCEIDKHANQACAPMTADTQRCIELAKTYAIYALKCGTAPVVPHFYALCDEANPRETVENAGRSLLWFCDELWLFGEPQQTKAMKTEIHFCKNLNIPIRHIDPKKGRQISGGNARQLLHLVRTNMHYAAGMGVFRLFCHMGKILENNIRDDRNNAGGVDRKLRRQINEKKQAQGLKME